MEQNNIRSILTQSKPLHQQRLQALQALRSLTSQLRSKAITADGTEATFLICDNIICSSLYEREGGKAQKTPDDAINAVIAEWKPPPLVMDADGAEVDILGGSNLEGLTK